MPKINLLPPAKAVETLEISANELVGNLFNTDPDQLSQAEVLTLLSNFNNAAIGAFLGLQPDTAFRITFD